RQHRGDADQESEFGGGHAVQAQEEREQDRGAGPGSARKAGSQQLAQANRNGNRPGNAVTVLASAQPVFDNYEQHSSDKQGDGNGQQIFGQFKVLFIHLIATRGGDGKGDEELEHVILGRGLAPTKEKLVQSVAKERKHGQD